MLYVHICSYYNAAMRIFRVQWVDVAQSLRARLAAVALAGQRSSNRPETDRCQFEKFDAPEGAGQ